MANGNGLVANNIDMLIFLDSNGQFVCHDYLVLKKVCHFKLHKAINPFPMELWFDGDWCIIKGVHAIGH